MLVIAAILGNTLNYSIGRAIGPRAFSGRIRLLKVDYLHQTEAFFRRYGGMTIVISRFMPIIRTFAPFVAGIGQMPYARFQTFNVVGGISWVLLFIWGGYLFGNIPIIKEQLRHRHDRDHRGLRVAGGDRLSEAKAEPAAPPAGRGHPASRRPAIAYPPYFRKGPGVSIGKLVVTGHGHPVTAFVLAVVERSVRLAQQFFGRSVRAELLPERERRAHRSSTSRRGRPTRAASAKPHTGRESSPQRWPRPCIRLRQHNHEFFAAVARDPVRGPNQRLGDIRQPAQYFVAGLVAALVVDLLEAIEVRHDRGEGVTVAPRALHFLQELIVQVRGD